MLAGAQDVHPFEQRVRRTASSGAWHAFFTERDTEFFNRYFEAFLRKFGYPLEQRQANSLPVSSVTGSEYVSRLIDEARASFESKNARSNQREIVRGRVIGRARRSNRHGYPT